MKQLTIFPTEKNIKRFIIRFSDGSIDGTVPVYLYEHNTFAENINAMRILIRRKNKIKGCITREYTN